MAKKDKTKTDNTAPATVGETGEQTGLVKKSNGQFEYIAKKRNVRAQTRRRTLTLIVIIFLLIAILITGAIYGILAFIDFNSFRITVDRTSGEVLSLSQSYDFSNPTTVLGVNGPKYMDNVAYQMIPVDEIIAGQGELNGSNYIANTFFLKNMGANDCRFNETISLSNTYKGLDAAMRLLVVKNVYQYVGGEWVEGVDEYYCYAKAKADGTAEYVSGGDSVIKEPEVDPNYEGEDIPWQCVNFLSDSVILNTDYYDIAVGQTIRYSLVVWLEGTDEQCVDEVLGGKVSLAIKFTSAPKE